MDYQTEIEKVKAEIALNELLIEAVQEIMDRSTLTTEELFTYEMQLGRGIDNTEMLKGLLRVLELAASLDE